MATGQAGEGPWLASLARLNRRSRKTLRDRARRVRGSLGLALQTGLAAGLAWFLASDVVAHPHPFFAPVAAVVTLGVSVGQRLRRAAELVIGVALGIGVGDALILSIGTGPVQIGVMVTLAIGAAVFLGGGSSLVTQGASSAVLVATLTPPTSALHFTRFFDALIGGGVALAVMAVLLPLNPLRAVARAARPALETLADGLAETAAAMAGGDARRAEAALGRMRAGEADVTRLREAVTAGRETITLAPVLWRVKGPLRQYVDSAEYVTHALRNARVLVRRVITLITDGEPVPAELAEAVALLGDAVRLLRSELAAAQEPEAARERVLRAVRQAARGYAAGVDFSGSVIVAQVRSIGIDLLHACGVSRNDSRRLVRLAAGRAGTDSLG